MERAETLLLSPTSAFKLYEISDDIFNRCVLADVGYVFVSNASGHGGYLRLCNLA